LITILIINLREFGQPSSNYNIKSTISIDIMLSAKLTRPQKSDLLKIVVISLLLLSQTFWTPNRAEALNQASIDRVKKIVMMLNIAAKEFEEGVVDGKIVVPPEYEESQVFLEQAIERFAKLSVEITDPQKAENLKNQLINMMGLVKD
jgi:hypothetical protein